MLSRNTLCLTIAALVAMSGQALADEKAMAEVGKPAPEFELKGVDGKTYKLADYKDKVVVLEWFNKDCPVCAQARPTMIKNSKHYADKGVVWLAVDSTAVRKVEENKECIEKEGIPFPILMDNDGTVGHKYGAKTTPHMFIVNKGTLVYDGAHDNKGDRDYVREVLDAVLAGKEPPISKTQPYGCTVKYKKGQ